MKRGMPVGRSRAASWAHVLGALAVPVLAIAALGSRIGIVPPEALLPALFAGFALAFAALGVATYALVDIWKSGAEGAGAALAGMVYASPVLLLLGGIAAAAVVYPRLTDVSTDVEDPPALEQAADPAAADPEQDRFALQGEAYPDITSRQYSLPIADVFSTARALVEERGWTITREVPPPSLPAVTPGDPGSSVAAQNQEADAAISAKATMTQSRGSSAAARVRSDTAEPAPSGPEKAPEDATLQAVARTLVFGFPDDVAIRFTATPAGVKVDMRSASGTGMHDLGQNARRVRQFLAALDAALLPDPNAPTQPARPESAPTAQADPPAPVGQ